MRPSSVVQHASAGHVSSPALGKAALTEGLGSQGSGRHCPLSSMCPHGPSFWGCFLVLCLGSALGEAQGSSVFPPLPHVDQYEVVRPLRLPVSGARNELSSRATLYPETIRYLLGLRGNNFTLHLRRNRHLLGSDYTETHTLANGTEVTAKRGAGHHCFYQGHVEEHQNSIASVSTCRGIRGFFKTGSTVHLIEPLEHKRHRSLQERAGSAPGRHNLTQGRHGGTPERHGGPLRRHGTSKAYESSLEKSSSPLEMYGFTQEKPSSSSQKAHEPERSGTTQGPRGGSDPGKQGSLVDRYDSLREKAGATQGKHSSTHEVPDRNQERPGDIQRRHGTTQGKQEGPEASPSKASSPQAPQGSRPRDQRKHAIYRQQGLKEKQGKCGVSKISLKGELETLMAAASTPLNWKPGAVSKETRYVELFVVVDNTEYKKYKSLSTVRQRVKEIVNHVDRIYQEINFRVVLIGLEIWDQVDKAAINSNIQSALASFLRWRESHLVGKKSHDNAQLITGVNFEGTIVGMARLASMCTEGSGGVNHDYSENPLGVATSLAHEMGHNLGMDHDENIPDCQCEESTKRGCVMASGWSMIFPRKFSSCSKENLQKFLWGTIFTPTCLNNYPDLEKMEGPPVCGNKFLEKGEECDCGLPGECLNQCCNPNNCRLASGAQCTEGECCQACQVSPAGQVCRESQNSCDLTEFCDGQHPRCPENVYKENGSPCSNGYCYNGSCPTYKQQCQALWGMEADLSTERCYLLEMPKACTEAFYPSKKGLIKCEFLFCSRPSSEHANRELCSFLLDRDRCDLAITKSENNDPFEMVATGTKCGKEKVCFQKQCQDLSIYGSKNCSSKCNSRGVCNHKQECHCDPGWAPPLCLQRLTALTEKKESWRLGSQEPSTHALNLKDRRVLVGVLVALSLLAILAILVFVLCKWKSGKGRSVSSLSPTY
ncbi:disintegrin and metalloproteinase domain-containing protein 8-like [Gracilinanus agilis]|uniref:disintegrin and metalloproteinase domain-containing protein 8-like n=1 Tax=Gracilinanus agilis TaxID=191870 RepID=UPI001CFD7F83|nr:disintegrin and metalloproteinase domain-containing protein 8-like [Gracilinanus agilis]